MRSRFLIGTRVERTADAATLAAGFAALRRRGRRAHRLRQVGCFLLVPVAAAGVWLMLGGHVWWTGILGLAALVLARLASYGDPELADDPRVALLQALFTDWDLEEPITVRAELNAPDMGAPDESERVAGGVLRARYIQPWLHLELPGGATLELVHERTQIEDGVEVRDIEDLHRTPDGTLTSDRPPPAERLRALLRPPVPSGEDEGIAEVDRAPVG